MSLELDITDALCLLAEYRAHWAKAIARAARDGDIPLTRSYGAEVERIAHVQERLRLHLDGLDALREEDAA